MLGTLNLFMSKPWSYWHILFGKFLAAFAQVLVAHNPTGIYYFSVYQLGNPIGNIDTPGVIGSYMGLALLGGVFCSVGILASSLTTNQVVAFILAAFLCFILYSGFDSLSSVATGSEEVLWIRQLGILYHYDAMSKGLIESRAVVYFGSLTGFLLLPTHTLIEHRTSQRQSIQRMKQDTHE